MKIGKNNIVTILIVIIGIIIISVIYFKYDDASKNIYITNTKIIETLENTEDGECTISLSDNNINEGDLITGRIQDGRNSVCSVYGKMDGDDVWRMIGEGTTNYNGVLEIIDNINIPGTFIFRAICPDCVTNTVELVVNSVAVSDCTDTDGKNKMTPGHVTYDDISYYDDCAGNWAVKEYWCNGNVMTESILACDAGYICTETRSGDYCGVSTPSYSPGDIIWTDSGSSSISGGSGYVAVITPGEMGFEVGGNCYLEVDLMTSWNWNNALGCREMQLNGVEKFQHMKWNFYDSAGLRFSRIDPMPISVTENIYPVNFDGINNWKLETVVINDIPGCSLNYDWRMTIKIAQCD